MAKKKHNVQQQMSPERYIREKARKLPIYKCYRGENPGNSREMAVVVIRQHKQGTFTLAAFLLDRWCVGVKDALWDFNISESQLNDFLDHYRQAMRVFEEVSYTEAHNWVYGAKDWATNAGIEPCKDFSLAKYIMEEDDDNVELIEYEFGLDGEYCLEAKNQQEANKYLPALRHTLGEGNFRVIISPLYGEPDDFEEDEDEASHYTKADLLDAMENLKKITDRMAELPDMEYTYKGGTYPDTLTLTYPQIQNIVEKKTEDITDKEMACVLSLPHDSLRTDLHQLILWEIGRQWGNTKKHYDNSDTCNWCTIGNAMMFLIEAGNEETVWVVLEALRQNDDCLDYNFGDIMDHFTKPLLFIFCKENPEILKEFLLEEGLTSRAKDNVFDVLTTIGLRVPEQRERVIKMTAKVLEEYKKNLPQHTICDGTCVAFGIDVLVSLGATEHLPLIEELYATGLIDEYVLGPIKSVRKEIKQLRVIDDRVFLSPYEVRESIMHFGTPS